MRFVVAAVGVVALFGLLALCEETETEDVDSYQEALMREVVLGEYAEARRMYLRIGEAAKSEYIRWLCRFRAALCAEKLGDFVTAKEEYGRIVEEGAFDRVVDAAKMGILRVDAHLKRKLRIVETLRERVKAYRALEAELKKADGKGSEELIRKSGVGEFIAHYFGVLSFLKGVDAYRRMEFESAAGHFKEALDWLPRFSGAEQYLKRSEFILGSGEAVTGEPPNPEDSLVEYLSSVSVGSSSDDDVVVTLLNQREVMRWLPEDAVSGRLKVLIDDVESRFREEAARSSGARMAEVERLDGEASAVVRRLKKVLSESAKTEENEGVVDATVVLWLRVLLLEEGLKDVGAVDVGKVDGGSGSSGFEYGTVDVSALRKANPRVLVAVEWRLDGKKGKAEGTVKGLVDAEGLVLSAVSVEGEKVSGSSVRVRLGLVWKKGGRVFNEVVERRVNPIYGFAELFGGWRLGKGYLFCSVEWVEK